MPRFDQSFNGLCEQNHQDTQVLKQRYLEPKAKRPNKPKDKKQQDTISSSVHVQQKFLKRSAEEHDPGGGGGPGGGVPNGDASFEPPVKLQCTTQQHGTQEQDGLTKFSVQIVQRVEFTTSAANSQPQQISTNVTVKAHTNASVKSDVASPKPSQQNQNAQNANQSKAGNGGGGVNTSNDSGMPDCVKQEPLNDFADLDECAAAVEKDAANGGMGFGNITDLIGDENNDELFTSPAFKAIIKDIAANFNEFNFDFDDKSDDLKVQDSKDLLSSISSSDLKSTPIGGASGNAGGGNFQSANQNCSPPVFENKRMPPYMSGDFVKTELSPAAQTLKQMAEQHQHQKQMGLSFNPPSRAPPGVANARSPYSDFPMNEYGSPNPNQNQNQSSGAGAGGGGNFHKNSPGFQQSVQGVEMIKQEMIYQGNEFDMKRKAAAAGIYKQQYSPYGSPSPGSHGSPGYLPRNNQPGGGTGAGPNGGGFAGATPPRPPSGPGGNNGTTTLQINQAQSMHISQQSHGHNIQVSAGQHLHLSGDLKGNVSIATQQGVHFQQQQQQQQATPHPNAPNAQTQPNNHTSHNSHQNDSSGVPQQGPTSGGPNANNPNMMNVNESMHAQNGPGSGPNQGPGSGPNQGMHGGNGGMSMNNMNMNNMSGMNNMNNMNMNAMNPNMGNMGNNVMMNAGHGPGGPGGPGQMNDSYSMTQSQTINFTQQTLRQRGSGIPPGMGMPTQMGAGGPGGPMAPNGMRHMTPMEQQKLMQQQQIIRAQQQAAMQQQQQQQQHMVRPPPPEYKASAGLMQGMGGPRYGPGPGPVPGAGPGNMPPGGMRRMPHQSMPPSGPMMRPHSMYMMQQQQQQQMAARGMYPPRQQGPMGGNPGAGNGGMDGGPGGPQHGSAEWRHMMMQQGNNFGNQMRPNFAQHQGANKPGFNMNAANPMQMQMAQPQMRGMNQPMMGQQGPGGGAPSQGGGPMAQMTSMNQQMMMQQQQNVVQGNNQMSMTNIHMQQTQSLSINSQSHHQQQQQQNQQQQQPQQNNQLSSTANNQNNDFLDLLAFQPDSTLSDQELLKFANEAGFNFNDINI